jgi:ribosomal protein S18 acetylase RimI-like enzyme
MQAGIRIRPARIADLDAVRALLVETWHDTYDALIGVEKVTEITNSWHSLENLGRQLEMPDTEFLVGEADREIVGHAFLNAQRPAVLIVSRLYVRPAYQRRGIGGGLLAEAIVRHPEADFLRLVVEADNEKGLAFYRGAGFQPIGERLEQGIRHLEMENWLRARSPDRAPGGA